MIGAQSQGSNLNMRGAIHKPIKYGSINVASDEGLQLLR